MFEGQDESRVGDRRKWDPERAKAVVHLRENREEVASSVDPRHRYRLDDLGLYDVMQC